MIEFLIRLWLEDGKKVDKYAGARSIEELKEYVNKMSGGEGAAKVEKTETKEAGEVGVLQLTTDNFQNAIEKGVTFIKFYAPWCGHCKRLVPTWTELSAKFIGNAGVRIAKVDCTLPEAKELCKQQEVNGFPTLLIYRNGEKLSEYNGSRSLDDLYEFVQRYEKEEVNAKDEL